MTIKIKRSDLAKLSNQELASIAKKLSEIDQANKKRSLDKYLETANPGQLQFHQAQKRVRFYLGGNRSGKTTGGTAEELFYALGVHPFKKIKLPNKGAVILQDFENHCRNVYENKVKEWCPAGAIVKEERNQNGAWRKVTFNTGSTIDIFSHDQDIKVFEGSDYDWAHFDEPPPRQIFNAVWRGLTDRGGDAWVTATPIVGPWMYAEIKKAEMGDPLRWSLYVDTEVNAKNIGGGDAELGKKRIEEFMAMLPEEEREARKSGKFLQMQGLIFKDFDRSHHMIKPFPWPSEWPIWESIDPHPAKPWAVSWIGVTPNQTLILLRSGLFDGVVDEIADQILYERSQIEIMHSRQLRISRCVIDNYASAPLMSRSYTDPTARRRSLREELEALIGPPRVEVAPKNVRQKIDLFKQLLHISTVEGQRESGFYAFDIPDNERFVYEIENYVWDTKRGGVLKGLKDTPLKENDDVIDTVLQVCLALPKQSTQEAGAFKAIR